MENNQKKEFKVYASPKDQQNDLKAVIIFDGLWLIFILNQLVSQKDSYVSGTGEVDPNELTGLTLLENDIDKAGVIKNCIDTISAPFDMLDALADLIIEADEQSEEIIESITGTKKPDADMDELENLKRFKVFHIDTPALLKTVLHIEATDKEEATTVFYEWAEKPASRTFVMRSGEPTPDQLKDTIQLTDSMEIGNCLSSISTDVTEGLEIFEAGANAFFMMKMAGVNNIYEVKAKE